MLAVNAESAKALFRRGQAYSKLNELKDAKADLLQAARLSPKDKTIRTMLDDVKKKATAPSPPQTHTHTHRHCRRAHHRVRAHGASWRSGESVCSSGSARRRMLSAGGGRFLRR